MGAGVGSGAASHAEHAERRGPAEARTRMRNGAQATAPAARPSPSIPSFLAFQAPNYFDPPAFVLTPRKHPRRASRSSWLVDPCRLGISRRRQYVVRLWMLSLKSSTLSPSPCAGGQEGHTKASAAQVAPPPNLACHP